MLLNFDRFDVLMLPFAGAMCPAKCDGEYSQQAFDALAVGNMSIFKIKSTFLEATMRWTPLSRQLLAKFKVEPLRYRLTEWAGQSHLKYLLKSIN